MLIYLYQFLNNKGEYDEDQNLSCVIQETGSTNIPFGKGHQNKGLFTKSYDYIIRGGVI